MQPTFLEEHKGTKPKRGRGPGRPRNKTEIHTPRETTKRTTKEQSHRSGNRKSARKRLSDINMDTNSRKPTFLSEKCVWIKTNN